MISWVGHGSLDTIVLRNKRLIVKCLQKHFEEEFNVYFYLDENVEESV